jgi:hypothetical protein
MSPETSNYGLTGFYLLYRHEENSLDPVGLGLCNYDPSSLQEQIVIQRTPFFIGYKGELFKFAKDISTDLLDQVQAPNYKVMHNLQIQRRSQPQVMKSHAFDPHAFNMGMSLLVASYYMEGFQRRIIRPKYDLTELGYPLNPNLFAIYFRQLRFDENVLIRPGELALVYDTE